MTNRDNIFQKDTENLRVSGKVCHGYRELMLNATVCFPSWRVGQFSKFHTKIDAA
jgi:hypothetical protein